MSYGEMLADSIMKNDGSNYAEVASKSLEAAITASKNSSEMDQKAAQSAIDATNMLVGAVGNKTTYNQDGTVNTPGSGFLGLTEGAKDYQGKAFDLTNRIQENKADVYNEQYNNVLEQQKDLYQTLSQSNNINNIENSVDNQLATEMNNLKLNHLSIGKVKAFMQNPSLLDSAVKTGEISTADYTAIKQLTNSGTGIAVKESGKLRLLNDYNSKGWLTDESLLKLAEMQSQDPFNKASGLTITDLYTMLQDNQRKLRNQGDLANHMFDLGYMVNNNLMDGDRALGNYAPNGTNVSQSSGSVGGNRANVTNTQGNDNTDTPDNFDDNINRDNIAEEGEVLLIDPDSARVGENGKMYADLNENGLKARDRNAQTDLETNNIMKNYEDVMTPFDSFTDAAWTAGKAIAPIAMFALPWGRIFGMVGQGGQWALNAVGMLSSGVGALSPEVAEEVKSQLNAHNKKIQDMRNDASRKMHKIRNMNISESEKQRQMQIVRDSHNRQVNNYRASIANENMWADEGMRKVLKDKGYEQRLKKAYANNDTKEVAKIQDELAKDKDIAKRYKDIQKEVANTKDKSKLSAAKKFIAKTPIGKGLKIAGAAYGVYEFIAAISGAISDPNAPDETDAARNPDMVTTWKDFKKELEYFGSRTSDRSSYRYNSESEKASFDEFISSGADFDLIKKDLDTQRKNGDISQREYSDIMTQVRAFANRRDALLDMYAIQDQLSRLNKSSKPYQLENHPFAGIANQNLDSPTLDENTRAQFEAGKNVVVRNYNSGIPNDIAKHGEISQGNAVGISALTGQIVTDEIDLGYGAKAKISKEKDPVVSNFLKTPKIEGGLLSSDKAGAPEGSIPSTTTFMIKSMVLNSGIDIHSESGARMLEDLNKDPRFQNILQTIDRYSRALKTSGSEAKIYDAVIELQNLMQEYGEEYMPSTAMGDLTNNRTFAELYSGYDNSNRIFHNRLVSQCKNAQEITRAVREGKIRPDAAMYYLFNPDEWRKRNFNKANRTRKRND